MGVLKSKSAQLSLFIIVGVIIISAIGLIFFLNSKDIINLPGKKLTSPNEEVSNCIINSIKNYEDNFFKNSLYLDTALVYTYNGETIPFLCYSSDYYIPCIPQVPILSEVVRKDLEEETQKEVTKCILSLKEDYEKRGYSVKDSNSFKFSLILNELAFSYVFENNIVITRGEDAIKIPNLRGSISSTIPKMLRTAETIVNYETSFCEFNYMTWQALNREITINRFRGGDQTKVYTLEDRNSDDKNKKEIKFAIRTCVMPAGI